MLNSATLDYILSSSGERSLCRLVERGVGMWYSICLEHSKYTIFTRTVFERAWVHCPLRGTATADMHKLLNSGFMQKRTDERAAMLAIEVGGSMVLHPRARLPRPTGYEAAPNQSCSS